MELKTYNEERKIPYFLAMTGSAFRKMKVFFFLKTINCPGTR
jgi:hypothetical protein